jgi:GT2 family glycosyltransferase
MARELGKKDKRYFLPSGSLTNPSTFDRDVEARLASGTAAGTSPARAGWCLVFPPEAVRIFWPIPEELQLWYGDDYMHHKLAQAGYRCESVHDAFVLHLGSQTVGRRADLAEVVARDKIAFDKILEKDRG